MERISVLGIKTIEEIYDLVEAGCSLYDVLEFPVLDEYFYVDNFADYEIKLMQINMLSGFLKCDVSFVRSYCLTVDSFLQELKDSRVTKYVYYVNELFEGILRFKNHFYKYYEEIVCEPFEMNFDADEVIVHTDQQPTICISKKKEVQHEEVEKENIYRNNFSLRRLVSHFWMRKRGQSTIHDYQ